MESGKILQSDYLDLIFDNRNKKYGGYELRKHYNKRALKALSITCAVILLGIGGPQLMNQLNAKEPVANAMVDHVTPVHITDPILPPPPKIKPPVDDGSTARARTGETIKNLPPKIVATNDVPDDDKPPETKELEHKLSGPVTSPGEEGEAIALSKDLHKGPFGDGVINNDKAKTGGGPELSDKPYISVEEMPEFPGGMKALAEYVRQNLRYPAAAKEDGIEGKVIISFVVNAQGAIEDAKVTRAIGGGCDKEALRVINAMPRWKPGRQNGHSVKVYYSLPIGFKLANQ